MPTYCLIQHPDCFSSTIDSIAVEVERPLVTALTFSFRASGRLTNVLVPDEVAPGFQDGLWRRSCFEAFLSKSGGTAYNEYNFSPSGHYAAYNFDSHREGMRRDTECKISHAGRAQTDNWVELYWSVRQDGLAEGNEWRLGLSAVIEEEGGTKSYWALAHAPGPPDFHNPACFIATLPAPERA